MEYNETTINYLFKHEVSNYVIDEDSNTIKAQKENQIVNYPNNEHNINLVNTHIERKLEAFKCVYDAINELKLLKTLYQLDSFIKKDNYYTYIKSICMVSNYIEKEEDEDNLPLVTYTFDDEENDEYEYLYIEPIAKSNILAVEPIEIIKIAQTVATKEKKSGPRLVKQKGKKYE